MTTVDLTVPAYRDGIRLMYVHTSLQATRCFFCRAFRLDIYQAKVRAISHPRPVTVLFYSLDPMYPGLPHVAALDVEGFLTNSESTRQYLLYAAPTALVPLGVDIEAFPFYPDPPCPCAVVAATAKAGSDDGAKVHNYNSSISEIKGGAHGCGRVVYVGAAPLMEYKGMLSWMLREAAPYGLDIYGWGWEKFPEFSGYWRGVLPQEDLVSKMSTFFSPCEGAMARTDPSRAVRLFLRSNGLFPRQQCQLTGTAGLNNRGSIIIPNCRGRVDFLLSTLKLNLRRICHP